MSKLLVAILASVSTVLQAQQLPYITYRNPNFLYAGTGATDVSVFNQGYRTGLTALWNGSPRPTSPVSNNTAYTVKLTAEDLAAPQLGVMTMIDSRSGTVVDTVNWPVGYNVKPVGLAFDRTRNRLYIATPATPANPQFPANSIVVLDVTTGKIGPILPVGSELGDIALSDDASTLYVVVEGDNVVRRINPETMTAVGDFNFRPPGYKGPYPGAAVRNIITVMPGKPGTVALGFSPDRGYSGTQVAIYDNGVKRPNVIESSEVVSMLFSPDGKYLFQGRTVSFSLTPSPRDYSPVTVRYSVDATGIPKQTPATASGTGPVTVVGGTLYTSLATTIDYQAMSVTSSFGIGGPLAIDSANKRAYILFTGTILDSGGGAPPVELVAFSLPGLESLGAQGVGVTAITELNDSERLIRFGADGFIVPSTAGLLIFHSPLAGPSPSFTENTVLNAASLKPGPIAPGEIISIKGSNLGPPTVQSAVSSDGAFPSSLSGVQVWFGRSPGIPIAVYQGQINVVAPFSLPGTPVDVQVWNFGVPSPKIRMAVALASPALFTRDSSGAGLVVVANEDGSINTPSPPGSIVTLYGTGGGLSSQAVDGAVARRADVLLYSTRVKIAGRDADVLYSGSAPGFVYGAFQLNVRVPRDAPPGPAPIVVSVGGQESTQGATLEIR